MRGLVALVAAPGLIRNRHLDKFLGEQRFEDLVPELGPVGPLHDFHEIRYCACLQARAKDLDLIPT